MLQLRKLRHSLNKLPKVMQLIQDKSRICYDKSLSDLLARILTILISFPTSCNKYELQEPVRPDFSLPWEAASPLVSL